jgi:hypothetical protein
MPLAGGHSSPPWGRCADGKGVGGVGAAAPDLPHKHEKTPLLAGFLRYRNGLVMQSALSLLHQCRVTYARCDAVPVAFDDFLGYPPCDGGRVFGCFELVRNLGFKLLNMRHVRL